MDFLKANIELSATDFKAREKEIRLRLTKSVKERLNDVSGLQLKQMLLDLANQFPEQGHTFYDSDNMQKLKPNIDNISNYIISHNVDISIYKNDFDDLVNEKQKLVDSYCKRNGAPKPQQNLSERYTKDLYRRLGNLVIESAKSLKGQEIERLKLNAKYGIWVSPSSVCLMMAMSPLMTCSVTSLAVSFSSISYSSGSAPTS